MEWPPWLKSENIVKNLSISGLFRDWFKQENHNHTEISIENLILVKEYPEILIPQSKQLSAEQNDSTPVTTEIAEKIVFTEEQKLLIDKINLVHLLNGRNNYDFREDFAAAIYHKTNKLSSDWYITAAVYMCNAIPDGGIRNIQNCLEKEIEPEKIEALKECIKRLQASFNNLQKIRHADKRKELSNELLSPYDKSLGITKIPDSSLVQIFEHFEGDLLLLFTNYEVKNEKAN